MRILVTNDDGIAAPGLKTMERIAGELAGPEGEVWTVAPALEQSGVGHCISYTYPILVAQLGERRYQTQGSPADCVLAGLHDILADSPPDLVLSGVNRGNNSAENVPYSGTIGAAMEAALQGVTAIALSQYMGPGTAGLEDRFEAADRHGVEVARKILESWPGDGDGDGYRLFYNVNFPPVAASEVRGIKVVRQGLRRHEKFRVHPHISPSGRRFLWIEGGDQQAPADPDTDAGANLDGYVSVTPMRADLTAQDALEGLRRIET